MKLLLKGHSNNEYWEADYLLVEPAAHRPALTQLAGDCTAFLAKIGSRFFGHVSCECPFGVTAGSYSLEDIQDGHAEKELDDQGWTLVPDDFEFAEGHTARIECISLRVFADGDLYVTALSKYSSDTVEAALPNSALDAMIPR